MKQKRNGFGLARLFAVVAAIWIFGPAFPATAQTTDDIVHKGEINIGVTADSVPYGYLDGHQQLVGFEVDLAKKLGAALGVKTNLIAVPAPSRIQYLLTGKVDMLIAFLAITPERAKQVLFSDPYSVSQTVVFAPKSKHIASLNDLAGLRIAVGRGNTADFYLTDTVGSKATVMRFDDSAAIFQALVAGQADAVAVSALSGWRWAQANPGADLDLKLTLFSQVNGMVVRKDQFDLQQWVNAFIAYEKGSGDLEILYRKWFKEPMPAF